MIGVLDPALFLPRADKEVERDLDQVILACREHSVQMVPIDEYWPDLWQTLARPLEQTLSASAKRPLQELRKRGGTAKAIPALVPSAGVAWRSGFRDLFALPSLGTHWEERMASALLRAVAADEDVVVFTRHMAGRNVQRHAAGDCTLDEITRWVLHVQPKAIGHRQILCVHHPRNLKLRWTARFDWRLPAESDGARYPFCPPDRWWKRSTPSHRTVGSKPAWVDKLENGWARPNISKGSGYHWDVFIQSAALEQTVGLSQINVVEYGAPAREGKPGHCHHVPTEKAGKLTGSGWSC